MCCPLHGTNLALVYIIFMIRYNVSDIGSDLSAMTIVAEIGWFRIGLSKNIRLGEEATWLNEQG